MSEKRVCLLSDFAAGFVEKGRKISGGNSHYFWNGIIKAFSADANARDFYISGISTELSTAQLEEEQFIKFCKIENRYIYVQKTQKECWVAIVENGSVWDLSDWGEDYCFVTRLIAEVYFMITRDDYRIDQDEKTVFEAIVGCIDASAAEIIDARCLVYYSLLENVIADRVITHEEEQEMALIRDALEMRASDVNELHRKLLKDYYSITLKFNSGQEISIQQQNEILEMADKLGVEVDFLHRDA